MAAYYNCTRKGEVFSGIAFGCSIEWETLRALWVVQRDKVKRVADGHPSRVGCSRRDLTGPGRLVSSLSRGRLHLRRQTVCPAKIKRKRQNLYLQGLGVRVGFFPCPEAVRSWVYQPKITLRS